jgi:predicted PurR-regulated permease PerM
MSAANPSPRTTNPEPTRGPRALEWLPWEKITLWSLFILAVWALRHFFFVIFMTFIVAYSMRGLVVRLSHLVAPRREVIWLQRVLAVLSFAALLGALYGAAQYFGPELWRQGEGLRRKVATLAERPEEKLDEVLRDTLGYFLFRNEYGDSEEERYKTAFESYQAQGIHYKEYTEFGKLMAGLQAEFESVLSAEKGEAVFAAIQDPGRRSELLREWVSEHIVEERLRSDREALAGEWEKTYRQSQILDPALRRIEDLSAEEKEVRLRYYLAYRILGETSTSREALELEWKAQLGRDAVRRFKAEDPSAYREAFRAYFEKLVEHDPKGILSRFRKYEGLLTFEGFDRLRQAYEVDKDAKAFSEVWETLLPEEEKHEEEMQLAKDREGFELREREKLVRDWKQTEFARRIGDQVEEYIAAGLSWGWNKTLQTVPKILFLPVQLALSLLLAFLITFDVPRLKKGIARLKDSRARNFYEEIAPGLISFGRLIGRAFQAQGVIAVFNTLLTFLAIKLLGIENEAFLCSIVFLCSFIPVLGVVLSSVPIGIMAIIQDGGGIGLALWAIGAILVIHFIETSLLNPKILGDMMHLHPVLVLAILAVGEHFFGVWGLLLGVPVIVYIIRFVILDEGIPGIIEPVRRKPVPAQKLDAADAWTADSPAGVAEALSRKTPAVRTAEPVVSIGSGGGPATPAAP